MAQSVDDVLIGTGDLYIGPVGTDFPANPSTSKFFMDTFGIFRRRLDI